MQSIDSCYYFTNIIFHVYCQYLQFSLPLIKFLSYFPIFIQLLKIVFSMFAIDPLMLLMDWSQRIMYSYVLRKMKLNEGEEPFWVWHVMWTHQQFMRIYVRKFDSLLGKCEGNWHKQRTNIPHENSTDTNYEYQHQINLLTSFRVNKFVKFVSEIFP